MRLPNNYGSISKLSGKRRNPYMILIHCDKDEDGKRTRKPLSYHSTYKEAFAALKIYNDKPYDLRVKKPIFSEVFNQWIDPHTKGKSEELRYVYQAAFKNLTPLHDMTFDEIRPYHIEPIFQSFVSSRSKKSHMLTLLKLLYRHAMKLEIVDKDYSTFISTGEVSEPEIRTPYSELEVKRISKQKGLVPDSLMIMFYTGFRISELLELKSSNVDLENMTIKGGIKSEAGKNRLVPIHPSILPIVAKYKKGNHSNLIHFNNSPVTYQQFAKQFNEFKTKHKLDHNIHEARHTFITNLDTANADDNIVKLLVGHAQTDFTKRVYTHTVLERLREVVLLLSSF